ncbi:MAG: hypothetical protein HS110_03960 [Zoogloeaceae bacterium]|nr:hypothetical protein [Zoogloeaceae bacterium]
MSMTAKMFKAIVLSLTIMGASMQADAIGGGASWKEEVLLHDGGKLIVERSQVRGGRHEIGQEVPIAEHTVSFHLPGTGQAVTWKSEFGIEAEKSSLQLLALDVVRGVPYIVTHPTGCIAYNKWGRPNPPYVFYRYDGKEWQRMPLGELPAEIKEANVVIGTLVHERRLTGYHGTIPANEIKRINAEAKNPDVRYLRVFVREPITGGPTTCEKRVHYKCGWFGMRPDGTFNKDFADRMCDR